MAEHITLETSVREVIKRYPGALKVFAEHGVEVEYDCPESVLDFPLEDCEWMCHIDDVSRLVDDLNTFVEEQVQQRSLSMRQP